MTRKSKGWVSGAGGRVFQRECVFQITWYKKGMFTRCKEVERPPKDVIVDYLFITSSQH